MGLSPGYTSDLGRGGAGWDADGGAWAGGASSVGASIHGGGGRGAGENQAVLFEALYIIHWPKPMKGNI